MRSLVSNSLRNGVNTVNHPPQITADASEISKKIKATEAQLASLIQEATFQGVIRKVKDDRYPSRVEQEASELKETLKILYETLFNADRNEKTKAEKNLTLKQELPYLASDKKLLPRIQRIEGMMTPPVLTEATTHAVTGGLLDLAKSDLEKHVVNLKLKLGLLYQEIMENYPTRNVKSEILKIMSEIEKKKQGLNFEEIKASPVIQNLYTQWELLLHVKN
ncbi:MAG: hypothetical protein LW809_06040 [Vampirovibrionales bacterium]|jgi:hypothetical protein|nr:hypothetical protein [Vampirovibrionales bacterium]